MGKKPPRGLSLFFDACFPIALCRALSELDRPNQYRHLFDTGWPHNIRDEEWLQRLSREDIVISGDGRILKNPVERAAWVDSGLSGFFLHKSFPRKSRWEQAKFLIGRWEQILVKARKCRPGDTYLVQWSGTKLDKWKPPRR